MTKKQTPLSREDILQLEKYTYELQRFTEQAEILKDVNMMSFNQIMREIHYMSMALSIYTKLYPNDEPVVGLCLDDVKKEDNYLKYWFFSSAESAAYIIDESERKVKMMCEGTRSTVLAQKALKVPVVEESGNKRYKSRGWKFLYKKDFDNNPDNSELVYSPASSVFKLKTIKYSEG
jgi:hypothetical protein